MKRVKPIVLAALAVILTAGAVLADSRETLRMRLDSINVETQVRKRLGKPIDDLETASALLRDSIVGMRSASPSAAAEPYGAPDSSFLSSVGSKISSLLGSAVSFRPTGLFDWIIVSTGVVAVLSGLLLFIGILAGRRKGKKKAAAPPAPKRINLAPPETLPPLPDPVPKPGAGSTYNNRGLPEAAAQIPPPPVPPALASLFDTIHKVQTPPPLIPPPPQFQPPPQPQPLPPAPKAPEPTPLPPSAPPPLVINAPDSSASTKTRGRDIPKAGSPGFSDSVAADAKSGMSDVEISRKYQVSVDQVRLMLRMRQD